MKLTMYWIVPTVLLLTLAGRRQASGSPPTSPVQPVPAPTPTLTMAADLQEREYVTMFNFRVRDH